MKYRLFIAALSVSAVAIANAQSANPEPEETEIEEIIVSASLINTAVDEISTPLHIVSQDDIGNDATQSLGEMIDNLLGVASSDYGAAVGQPIIRGLSGSRVRVLSNGLAVRDVSALGADHINEIDLNQLQQIEIIRGPSSLLYANGTIGGIINIVDNSIAKQDYAKTAINLGGEAQTVNDGFAGRFAYRGNHAGLNFSAAYSDADFGSYDVPSDALEAEHAEHAEATDSLANSDFENTAIKLGFSQVADWGYNGVSFADSSSLYGIPYHGEEAHEEEHVEGEEEEEHEEERIFIDSDSRTFTFQGAYNFRSGFARNINYHVRDTDYKLTEGHAEMHEEEHEEEEHEEEGHEEEGHGGSTTFANKAQEIGIRLKLGSEDSSNLKQQVVFDYDSEEFSITGSEAFLPEVQSEETTIGYFIGTSVGFLSFTQLDFGIRQDQVDRKTPTDSFSDSATSMSLALTRELLLGNIDLHFGLSSVTRMPSPVELFIFGPHLVTQRFEEGNVNLKSEQSSNIDLTIDFAFSDFLTTFTLFQNDVSNYIYLVDEDGDHADEDEEEHDEHDHHGLQPAVYKQQDATLTGYEFEIGRSFPLQTGNLAFSFGRDEVTSKFSSGGYVPRAVPARNLYRLTYADNSNFAVSVVLKAVESQSNVAEGETETDGYQMLDARFSKIFQIGQERELTLTVFGKNLLDEVARNHTSFVKDEVPLPGRNFGVKVNVSF